MFIKKIHRSGQKTALRFYYVDECRVMRSYCVDLHGVDLKSNLRTGRTSSALAKHE